MKNTALIFTLIFASLLTACATSTQNRPVHGVVKSPRVLEIEKRDRQREDAKQDRKDQNRVLAQKSKWSVSPVLSAQSMKLSDRALYAEMVGSYDRNNDVGFFSRYQVFQKKYANSPLADDAAYLAGLFSLTKREYGPALRYFNQVLRRNPHSNKAASSMYAKGIVLKKMNLDYESMRAFERVKRNYPGSPEALRAETEMGVLRR